jgi:hypothetical protein
LIRGHAVRLVDDDEGPIRGRHQFGLRLLGTRRHVESHDQAIALDERVASDRCFDLLARQ